MSRRRGALWRLLSVVWTGAILFLAAQEGGKSHSLSTGLARLFGELLHPDFAAWRADVPPKCPLGRMITSDWPISSFVVMIPARTLE